MEEFISEKTILIPGPSFHVDLAPIDAFHPVHYSRRLLFFRCPFSHQLEVQYALLKRGLLALVHRFSILGGIITPLESARGSSTILPGPGIEFIAKDLRAEIPSFDELEAANFPIHPLKYDILVPVPRDLSNDRPFPALKIQFSAINGGTILTFAMSHTVADGSATDEFIRVLAEEIRLAQEDSKEGPMGNAQLKDSTMGLDRSVLRSMKSGMEFNMHHHPAYRWKTPSADLPEETHPFDATAPEIPILLRISVPRLAQLKADATTPGEQISTHDAMCALIWRSVILIRNLRSFQSLPSTMTKFFMPSDARKHVGLPSDYIGNSVYQLYAELELSTVLSSSGLQHCARAVRRAITAATPAVVQSFMAYYNNKGDGPTSIAWQFTAPGAMTVGVPMGTDWKSGDAMYADWGEAFGSVVSYRFPADDGNTILPQLSDGSAEVQVSVMPSEVEILRGTECFGRYL